MSYINMSLDADDLSLLPSKILWYGRLHPALNSPWISILASVNFSIFCLFAVLAIKGILVSYNNDIFFMSECLQTCILMIHGIGVLMTLHIRKPSVLKLLQQKSNFWKITDFDGIVSNECSSIRNIVKKILRCYYCLTLVTTVFFDLQPVSTGYLPTVCYVPHGWFNYLTGLLWYLSCVAFVTIPGTDGFFCSLAASLIIQFKLLAHRFKNTKFSKNESNTKLWQELKSLVNHHSFLLSYCEDLNTTFGSVFLLQFFLTIASCSVSLFIFVQPGAWINRFKFFLYFFALMVESAFYFVPLELVINSASHVATAVYESEWYNIKDLQIKKCLIVVLARSQKVIVFSAYGLIMINLRAFLVMCKTMFSFYAYLNTVENYRSK